MDDVVKQQKAIESLQAWSKWLIGLNFAGLGGCAFFFERSESTFAVTPFLLIAIAFFALSIGCAAVLLRELASATELVPLRGIDGNPSTVFEHRGEYGYTMRALTSLQLILVGVAAFFFVAWVVTKALFG